MFRSPKPGDWAAEDEDTTPLPTPTTPSLSADHAVGPSPAPRQDTRGDERSSRDGRFDRDRSSSGGRFERDNSGHFDRDRNDGGRFDRDRSSSGGRFNRDNRGRFERDRDNSGRFDGDRDNSGRFDRDRDNSGRFDRDRDNAGRFDRDRDNSGRFDRDRDDGRDSDRGGGRADAGRWGHKAGRRGDGGDRRGGGRNLPVEQGFVVSIKENFGFVSCMERDGDLFFHMSEAPVDVQLQDEVEFRVNFNQRSDKEMACQLVALPKGTIKVEEVADELFDGIVTKSLPRGGYGNARGFYNNRDDDRHQRREEYGLIEVKKTKDSEENDDVKEAALEEQEQDGDTEKKTLVRREFVRFTSDSVAVSEAKSGDEDQEESSRPKKNLIPHFGDEVRFRIAKHRKTGVKRAVDITITVSARDKLKKEIEAKLATMTREFGVVDRVKNGGGFIKCCDRPVDIYFPFHEICESAQADEDKTSDEKDSEKAESGGNPRRGRQGKGPSVREGDEVSFFVYEDQEDDSARSRPRLTALRLQKLPVGTVSFEELVRADVEGLVSKLPKEPRNGPEVIGSIAVTSVDSGNAEESKEVKDAVVETLPESEGKSSKKNKNKEGKAKQQKVAFRLCDVEDVSYVPHIGDKVAFDKVLDKRTSEMKAVKVRVVQLNSKNRETGIINAVKEDFGFIKCAERSGDAYFRFSDVMGTQRSFNNGTEVAFDVIVDSKSDHTRATRLQILPRGTIKWEDVAGEGLEGKIVAAPISRRGNPTSRGGRGDKTKQLSKFVPGKISFVTPQKQHLIDFMPDLKEKVDAAFITSEDVAEETQKAEVEEDKSKETEGRLEIRISFPSTLSKFERAALQDYSDWLGLKHASSGEGSHRQLDIFGSEMVSKKTVEKKLATSAPELTVEFKEDDVDDVRYNPRVGDCVRFDLVVVKRTKQFQCKSISCLEAAATIKTKAASAKSEATDGEGFIVSVKLEGFGFIQPAQTVPGSLEENLFFHVKEITTGQTLAELKEGTEVQYTIFVDEKKKKKRAMGISVVPAGTIKNVVPASVKGVVTKASFLHRLKGGAKGRFSKSNNKASTLGRIRLATAGSSAEDDAAASADRDSDDEAEEAAEAMQDSGEAKSRDAETEKPSASEETKRIETKDQERKTSDKQFYLYNIRDIADPAVVLREGDEVEFIPQVAPKNLRAVHIRLVASHAKQGIVTRITEDLGGVIRLDGDEPVVEARFTARGVLRGDILSEGDRVEFAYRPPSAPSIKNIPATSDSETKKVMFKDESEENTEECAKSATEPVLGHALSVLRLSLSSNTTTAPQRRGSRMVNSTLREAMRQVGANAMVASKLAKGPNGTRGFVEGWDSDSVQTTETSVEKITMESSSNTEQSEA